MAVLGVGPLLIAVPTASAAVSCPPAKLFYAAGSNGDQKPNLALAEEISKIGAVNFEQVAVEYPAVSIFSASPGELLNGAGAFLRVGDVGAYHDSVEAGKKKLRELISEVVATCGSQTRIILSGYSQGAQVAADVYQAMDGAGEGSRIYAMVLFGDPYFNGGSAGRGSSTGDLRHRTGIHGGLGLRPGYGRYRRAVRSYCHRRDLICQAHRPLVIANATTLSRWVARIAARMAVGRLSLADHKYHETGEAQDAGRWLASRLSADLARSTRFRDRIIRNAATGASYYVDSGGVRHAIPDGGVYLCLTKWKRVRAYNVTQATIDRFPTGDAAGCTIPQAFNKIIRVAATGKAYFVTEDGVRHSIPDGATYNCLRYWRRTPAYSRLTQAHVDAFPLGADWSCQATEAFDKIVRVATTGKAYYVSGDGVRHSIPNGGTYNCLDLWKRKRVYNVSQGRADSFPTGEDATCVVDEAYDKIVRVGATGKAYFVDARDGLRHSIQDGATYNCLRKTHRVYYNLPQEWVDTIPEGAPWPNQNC
jgi:hypothetical protein